MKKLNLLYFTIIVLSANPTKMYSQAEGPGTLIMGVPQHLIVDGLRIDIDLKMNRPNKWLVVSPIIFLSDEKKDRFETEDFNSLKGAGLELTIKQVLSKKDNATGIYLGFGPVFHYTSISNYGPVWTTYIQNNLEYSGVVNKDFNIDIYKLGGNCILGLQEDLLENVFVDFYLGFGFRYSLRSSGEGEVMRYNSSWIDYGYSGVLLVSGIRIGVGL